MSAAEGSELVPAVGYLRLSDYRTEGALLGRAEVLHTRAADLGWRLDDVIVENDLAPGAGDAAPRGASAFKRKRIVLPDGSVALRTVRPGFRQMLAAMQSGRARGVLAEDLDRLLRQPRDGEDLLDAAQLSGATVRSLSGSVTLTNGGTDDERFVARIMAANANKASADTGRRVSAARDRLAGQSWQGGRRPYGYRPDPDAPRWHKTLLIVPEEAAVLRWAAEHLLTGGSLKWLGRDLRERGVPTVTGAPWTTSTLRDALMKPAIVALAVRRGVIVGPAPWKPILATDDGQPDMETWERLKTLLNDPARRTNAGRSNEPRWLVSGFAVCGVCKKPVRVGGGGRGRSPAYVGKECGHVRRTAADVDELVAEGALSYLEQSENLVRLQPPERPGADTGALRAELETLGTRRAKFRAMGAAGTVEPDDLAGILAGIRRREDDLRAQLAASSAGPDLFAAFRDAPARTVWAALPMPQRRAIVQRLFESVVINRAAKRGTAFHPDSVTATPAPDLVRMTP